MTISDSLEIAREAIVLRRVILRLTVSKAAERGCVSAA
jgi:hypothetical protein